MIFFLHKSFKQISLVKRFLQKFPKILPQLLISIAIAILEKRVKSFPKKRKETKIKSRSNRKIIKKRKKKRKLVHCAMIKYEPRKNRKRGTAFDCTWNVSVCTDIRFKVSKDCFDEKRSVKTRLLSIRKHYYHLIRN